MFKKPCTTVLWSNLIKVRLGDGLEYRGLQKTPRWVGKALEGARLGFEITLLR